MNKNKNDYLLIIIFIVNSCDLLKTKQLFFKMSVELLGYC